MSSLAELLKRGDQLGKKVDDTLLVISGMSAF